MGFMTVSMFDKQHEAFGVIAGFGIRPKEDFGKQTAVGAMINDRPIGLLHISFCKRRAGFVSFAD